MTSCDGRNETRRNEGKKVKGRTNMFGSRLKSWMENYIGRPRKKEPQKEKPREIDTGGVILESSESLAQSDTGISSGSQQVLSSSTTDNREGYSTTTMESEKSGMTHCHTAISLPSPESAYSTGYSTDGASPGATGAPEYYINIRTGKHYFPSPAPTPTSPHPNTAFLNLPEDSPAFRDPGNGTYLTKSLLPHSRLLPHVAPAVSTSVPEVFNLKSPSKKSAKSSLKLFLKSPKQEKCKPKSDFNKIQILENKKNEKPKKWFKQPFRKFGSRRPDFEERIPRDKTQKEVPIEKNFRYLLNQENSASPRQRNRIKTNPWLPTEPVSSLNFQTFNFSPNLTRNRSCSNTPLQNRKTTQDLPNRMKSNLKSQEPRDDSDKPMGRHPCGRLFTELSDHSEEDLTLNEMMGTYNESYVYEKETDILSDSDPTDCEDYGTDSEAENGGDERDSHDDELDFIDNGSVTESDDNFPRNTGKCTYYDVRIKKNSFLSKADRHHSRKDSKTRREKRRPTRKSFKRESEERKKSRPKAEIDENVGGLNLSRVLAERMMAKNISKSAEGTPITARRRKLRETHIGNEIEKKPEILTLGDVEADTKYKELIKEAENMIQTMRNSPVIKARKEMDVWKKTSPPKEPETPVRKSPRHLGLKLTVETPKKFESNSFKAKSSAHSPLDPLGPALRNFAVFKPLPPDDRKISTSSSEDFDGKERPADRGLAPFPVVPIAFQSVDLGKPLTSYCPQSEPVKRKIYSCSKTYDKLVKQFENKPTIFEETSGRGPARQDLETCLNGNQGSLPNDENLTRGRACHGSLFGPRKPFNSSGPQRRSFA